MNYYIITIFLLINIESYAQNKSTDSIQDIERVLRNVAGRIIQNTTFKIVNTKSGKTFLDSKEIPVESGYKIQSPYNEWKYWNGVLNIGFIALGNQLNDSQYVEYAKRNVSFVFDHDDFFMKMYRARIRTGMHQKFRMALPDDYGGMGAGILAVHQYNPQQRYRKYLDSATNYIMTREKRLEDGTFCRSFPYKMTVWGDDLYMSVSFLSRMGKLTGNQKYFDEAARQVILFNKYLWNQKADIFFHCWYDDIGQNGVAHWGRCNGWIIMAQVELLDQLADSHPKRKELIQLLTRQIVGLSRYQDASGLWHQLIDKENTFLETSSSAMFTYAIAKSINEGWLDSRYVYIAAQGWKGVSGKILADGQVEGICAGTGINSAAYYYANRPTPLNDIHGLGVVLLAGCEVLQLYQQRIILLDN
jgi:unsaturated rhamnogalacturonyl hydrolase